LVLIYRRGEIAAAAKGNNLVSPGGRIESVKIEGFHIQGKEELREATSIIGRFGIDMPLHRMD
jgi:hypothetical protein